MAFLNPSYLLNSAPARALYADVAGLPVIDPHSHADVKRIADDTPFSDPWEFFAQTDHDIWELMRKRLVPERLITGDATNREKWMALARVCPEFAGNPMYEWIHLDLRAIGCGGIPLNEKTGPELWDKCSKSLASAECRPRVLLRKMNVETLCSTDDPADTLEDHDRVNNAFGRRLIRPAWCPDKLMKIASPGFQNYLKHLEKRWNKKIRSTGSLLDVLHASHDFFAEKGAVLSDHCIEKIDSIPASAPEADAVLQKVLSGEAVTEHEAALWRSFLMEKFADLDAGKNWVLQLRTGVVRNVRKTLFETLGPDSGGDVTDPTLDLVKPLCRFLNRHDGRLKTVLYSLDPCRQSALASVARAFGGNVRLGAAWCLNDTPAGMRRQLETVAEVDLLRCFAGMASDSRKITSYSSRFEMFRRVLCDVAGTLVETGRIPEDIAAGLVRAVCYSEPKHFYNLD